MEKKIHLQEKSKKKKEANLQQIKWLIYEGKIAELRGEGQINKKKTLEIMKKKSQMYASVSF